MKLTTSTPVGTCSFERCPEDWVLVDFSSGRLDTERFGVFQTQLETCSVCQARISSLHVNDDELSEHLRALAASQSQVEPFHPAESQLLEAASHLCEETPDAGATSATPPPQRTKLGDYELLEVMARHGMGVVYRGRHTLLDRPVAIKLLPPLRGEPGVMVARFLQEMKAGGRLDHDHIVRVLHAGEVDGELYLVMELIDGWDLSQLVRRNGPLSIADACACIQQAAAGLEHVHEEGLIHRDIKPSNIMMTARGRVKILDLGLSRWQGMEAPGAVHTPAHAVLGTPDFLAPEQAASARSVDKRADIYALGGTLFYLLTGQPPFEGEAYQTVFQKVWGHMKHEPPRVDSLRSDIPAELAEYIHRLLAKSPDERPASAAEVAEAMAPWAKDADLPRLAAALRGIVIEQAAALTVTPPPSEPITPPIKAEWRSSPPPQNPSRRTALYAAMLGPIILLASGIIVEFVLKVRVKPDPEPSLPATAAAAEAYLAKSRLPAEIRERAQQAIRSAPNESRWLVEQGDLWLGVVARPLPGGPAAAKARANFANVVLMQAAGLLLTQKALVDQYASSGLTNHEALREALQSLPASTSVEGDLADQERQAGAVDDVMVGYRLVRPADLSARLKSAPIAESLRTAYRDAVHAQARDAMAKKDWAEALRDWAHLHQLKLTSPELYLDAARCYQGLDQKEDSLRLLSEAMSAFESTANSAWLEQVGDLAAEIGGVKGDSLAVSAYEKASEGLRDVKSPAAEAGR